MSKAFPKETNKLKSYSNLDESESKLIKEKENDSSKAQMLSSDQISEHMLNKLNTVKEKPRMDDSLIISNYYRNNSDTNNMTKPKFNIENNDNIDPRNQRRNLTAISSMNKLNSLNSNKSKKVKSKQIVSNGVLIKCASTEVDDDVRALRRLVKIVRIICY